MSRKVDTRGSVDAKDPRSGSDDGSERAMKRSFVDKRYRYTSEFLLKLQKGRLSKKTPECISILRRENILRDTWRGEKEERKEEKEGPVVDLGMTRRSFVAGCQIANIQPEKPVSNLLSSLSTKDPVTITKDRRVGSGRIGNRDLTALQKEYGYANVHEKCTRRSIEFRHDLHKRGKHDHHTYSHNNDHHERPEWFTEGPKSRMEVIELGGFDEVKSTPTTQKESKEEDEKITEQPNNNHNDLRKPQNRAGKIEPPQSLGATASPPPKATSPINLDHLFMSNVPAEPIIQEPSILGHSRFMSEVFAKPDQNVESRQQSALDLPRDPTPEDSCPILNELLNFDRMNGMNGHMQGNQMPAISRNNIEALLNQERFDASEAKSNNEMNIFEQLLSMGVPTGPQPPPMAAKSVVELEADLKSSYYKHTMPPMNRQAHPPPQQPPPQMYQKPKMDGMYHNGGMYGNMHVNQAPFENYFKHATGFPHQAPPLPPTQENTHNIPVDLLRLFKHQEPPQQSFSSQKPHPPAAASAFKQDMKNVPTQVLLREKLLKDVQIGPRAIVKSNKNPPMANPMMPPPQQQQQQQDNGTDFLQKFLENSAHQQHYDMNQQYRQPQMGGMRGNRQAPFRPLTGMHGPPRYMDASQYGPPPQHQNEVILDSTDALFRWFGNLNCQQATPPPVPANVVRADELERMPLKSKLPTAT